MTRYLSIAEAADALGVTPRTVRRYIAAGTLEARRIGGSTIRIPEHALATIGRPLTVPRSER